MTGASHHPSGATYIVQPTTGDRVPVGQRPALTVGPAAFDQMPNGVSAAACEDCGITFLRQSSAKLVCNVCSIRRKQDRQRRQYMERRLPPDCPGPSPHAQPVPTPNDDRMSVGMAIVTVVLLTAMLWGIIFKFLGVY